MSAQQRDAVRKHWCASANACDGKHGFVHIGSLDGARSLRLANLTLQTSTLLWTPESQRCWRLLLPSVMAAVQPHGGRKVVYQFGVYRGASMYLYRRWWPEALLLGFDSFAGLPAERVGEVRRATWVAGTFGIGGETGIVQRLQHDLGSSSSRFFRGFFNETLTPRLASSLPQATLVDIDSDIYRSAFEALDWLFEHRLAGAGTLVAYDDWLDYACAPLLGTNELQGLGKAEVSDAMRRGVTAPSKQTRWRDTTELGRVLRRKAKRSSGYTRLLDAGEPKAHAEIAQRHGVRFRCLAGSCAPSREPPQQTPQQCDIHQAFGAIFIVESVGGRGGGPREGAPGGGYPGVGGGGGGSHGIEMVDGPQLDAFRKRDAACKWVRNHRFTMSSTDALPVL
jgi:hypothetical protein